MKTIDNSNFIVIVQLNNTSVNIYRIDQLTARNKCDRSTLHMVLHVNID